MSTSLLQTNQFSKLVIDLGLIVEEKFSGWFIEYQQCNSLCKPHRSENKQNIQAHVHTNIGRYKTSINALANEIAFL